MTTVYDFSVKTADGGTKSLKDYEGKLLLIVNVASKCGLTPQYEGLETLYREEAGKGLEILAFPSNQFKGQEPGTDEEIQEFCKTTYDVTFPVFAKIDVNGADADPLYAWLKSEAPGNWGPELDEYRPGFVEKINEIQPAEDPADVKWNFNKFLVGRDGTVIGRFEPPVPPEVVQAEIQQYL